VIDDFERCYRFMRSRNPRYDGFFFVGVRSTGIYCRPSCPARLPRRRNVRLFRTAAAAHDAGLRTWPVGPCA
jgi:AraC family transcriptional regulator, regulatory protein of adaptative response / DNA-3-methyladenine glycosylase II